MFCAMTAAVPRMGKGGKVVLFVVMVVVVVVVIVVVVKVERRMGSRQVESSGRSGSRGSFLHRGSYKWRFELLVKMCFCESSNKKK